MLGVPSDAVLRLNGSENPLSTKVLKAGDELSFLSLQIPMGTVTPDPDIKRENYEKDENDENNSSLTGIYTEGGLTQFNDSEFLDFFGLFLSLSIQSFQENS